MGEPRGPISSLGIFRPERKVRLRSQRGKKKRLAPIGPRRKGSSGEKTIPTSIVAKKSRSLPVLPETKKKKIEGGGAGQGEWRELLNIDVKKEAWLTILSGKKKKAMVAGKKKKNVPPGRGSSSLKGDSLSREKGGWRLPGVHVLWGGPKTNAPYPDRRKKKKRGKGGGKEIMIGAFVWASPRGKKLHGRRHKTAPGKKR